MIKIYKWIKLPELKQWITIKLWITVTIINSFQFALKIVKSKNALWIIKANKKSKDAITSNKSTKYNYSKYNVKNMCCQKVTKIATGLNLENVSL